MKDKQLKNELAKLEMTQLLEKLDQTRRELFSTRLNATTAHVTDYSQFKILRRNIARILTVINIKKHATKLAK